ncbi:DUF4321 domain-containing protein [Paenibacillus cisolokensis]|uniref:DUF4321 domain-containing protein n=1 Tax=Paenibacillus cisolokensis TaxID=1658519 RepID=UPI003D288B1D
MKKNGWILMLFIVLGLLAGALVARWLPQMPGLTFLTQTESINLSPAADLHVFRFDLTIGLELSLLSIIGAVLAVWLYRRM